MSGVGKENIWKKQCLEVFQFGKNYIHTDPKTSTKLRHKKHKEKYNKYAMVKLVKMSDKKENVQWNRDKKDQDAYVIIREKRCKYKLKNYLGKTH